MSRGRPIYRLADHQNVSAKRLRDKTGAMAKRLQAHQARTTPNQRRLIISCCAFVLYLALINVAPYYARAQLVFEIAAVAVMGVPSVVVVLKGGKWERILAALLLIMSGYVLLGYLYWLNWKSAH